MSPEEACPQNFIHNGNIVYTSPDGYFSIARGIWVEDGTERFAMRWNGDINDPNDKGYPKVFNYPMWFQLPNDSRDLEGIVKSISDGI